MFVGGAGDIQRTHSYNPASQMVSRTLSNEAYAFTGEVDAARSYAVNGLNQYVSAGGLSLTYDANGNLTSDGRSTYLYDVENRLVSRSGEASASLRYDPLGRLFEVTGASEARRFLYDGDELVAEYDLSGTITARYVHGRGTDDPLVWYEGPGIGDRRYLHSDERGSITGMAGLDGRIRHINSYDAWGIPALTNQGRFGYTGQIWLPALGMWYYKARIYSPTLGRFMQTDPIGYEDQVNLYAYVGNDPVNNLDPDGMKCVKRDADGECEEYLSVGKRDKTPPRQLPANSTADATGGKKPPQNMRPTRYCYGPPPGPAGTSASELASQSKINGDAAAQRASTDLGYFYSQVRNNGPQDYKQYDRAFQNYGNYNYGYVGTRQGIAAPILRAGAGYAQVRARTSRMAFITTAFDDPKDQEQINRGISDAQNNCY